MKRALVLSTGEVLSPDDFAFLSAPAGDAKAKAPSLEALVAAEVAAALAAPGANDLHPRLLGRIERPLLEAVLAHTGGNQLRAAAILGINRNTLRKRMVELGLARPART